MTVSEERLGFAEAIQLVDAQWLSACSAGLAEAGASYVMSDTALAPQCWSDYRVLVLSTYEYVDADVQAAVVGFARAGGTVLLGPRLPHLDGAPDVLAAQDKGTVLHRLAAAGRLITDLV